MVVGVIDAAWWPGGAEVVRVLERESLWGAQVATVAVPSSGRILRLASAELAPLAERPWTAAEVAWRAACGLVLRARTSGHEPLAVAAGRLAALPHQLAVLERALAHDPVRLLLADEVGLGKTIEAGLVFSELKAAGLVRRCVVVAPKGVQLQWVAEMQQHFGEEFVLVGVGGISVDAGFNPWVGFDQVVCSLDAVKPLRARAGWSAKRLAEHNDRRVRALLDAGWDLVIIDEAHHAAGSSEEVARHLLGRELAQASPRLLLLSATPHSGKSDAFARLLSLLDDGFAHGRPLTRSEVAPYVVRTEKRNATDSQGRPLFRPRTTRLETISYGGRESERELYEAVTEYVRHGYRRARAEGRLAIGFLVALMQRLVSSSTAAILAALERRLAAVGIEGAQLALFGERLDEWPELSGEEQQACLSTSQGQAWAGERVEVESLVFLARRVAASGIDAKARHLLELLASLVRDERDPGAKAVVFTEFISTQAMLSEVLGRAGIAAVAVNGQMSIAERRDAQGEFREDARVLVSTDAGGEGVNLQFAHVVVNYDLPWSPTKIEQRIGRVDRIGQRRDVAAHNLVLEASIDARVLAVLEEKLAVILTELGADKAGDILASADDTIADLYEAAIMDPTTVPSVADALERSTRLAVQEAAPMREALGPPPPIPAQRHDTAQLARWLPIAESACAHVGRAPCDVFAPLPEVLSGEPVPFVAGPTSGWWTMWEASSGATRTAFCLFLTDTGAVRPDLAERQWVSLAVPGDSPAPGSPSGSPAHAPSGSPVSGAPECPTGDDRWAEIATLDPAVFVRLREAAADHGYRDPDGAAPSLVLRLAVRVERVGDPRLGS